MAGQQEGINEANSDWFCVLDKRGLLIRGGDVDGMVEALAIEDPAIVNSRLGTEWEPGRPGCIYKTVSSSGSRGHAMTGCGTIRHLLSKV